MESQIKLGRVRRMEIGMHYSWFLIALLIALSLAGQFQATQPQWGGAAIWLASIVTALLFFRPDPPRALPRAHGPRVACPWAPSRSLPGGRVANPGGAGSTPTGSCRTRARGGR